MNTYWIVCTMVAIAAFAVGEGYAFRHPDRMNTLSRAIATLGARWPFSIWLMGIFAGALAVHFFWHWDPNCITSAGNG